MIIQITKVTNADGCLFPSRLALAWATMTGYPVVLPRLRGSEGAP